jgi:LysR family nod box-dependent transcriptional activator
MRFKGLDLNLLQVLAILIERRSVTRCAELLHISQPAISAALARLRQHFDDPLLVQHGKQMIPTPFALLLAPALQAVIGDLDALISTPARFDPATSTRTFRLMASDFILVAVLGDMLPRIEAQAPHLRFTLVPPDLQSTKMLEAGDVDLVIAPTAYASPDHPAVPLFEERHVVAGWCDNPLMAQPPTRETLMQARFISVQIGRSTNTSFAMQELSQSGITLTNALTTTTFAAVPQLLVGTPYLAIMHETLAQKAARHLPITTWPLPVPIAPMQESMQYHRARAEDPGINWLVAQFSHWSAVRSNALAG